MLEKRKSNTLHEDALNVDLSACVSPCMLAVKIRLLTPLSCSLHLTIQRDGAGFIHNVLTGLQLLTALEIASSWENHRLDNRSARTHSHSCHDTVFNVTLLVAVDHYS